MNSNFINHINKYIGLNEEEISILWKFLKLSKHKKKDYLFKEGEVCKATYFVEKGCLRLFFINNKGVEQITQFAIENWWISDYMSFETQKPSSFYLQAIENSEIVVLEKESQEQLLKVLPKMERYFRLVTQRAYAASQMRLKFLHDFSKEESYTHFRDAFPGFMQRIPQYMLASYLGLTPEYLSEIRKK